MPALLSVQDAIFPAHPFSGLFALGREQNWRLREMFPAFSLDQQGLPSTSTRISYAQARESLLLARHIGGADLGILSGSRKSVSALGTHAAAVASDKWTDNQAYANAPQRR